MSGPNGPNGRKKSKHAHGSGGHGSAGLERWLLTYADMITLLMALFVVMFAMSELEKSKFADVAGQLKRVLSGGNRIIATGGLGDGVSVPIPTEIVPPAPGGAKDQPKPDDILVDVGQALYADFQRDGRFTVRLSERGLVISLTGSALFDSGKADIKPEFAPLLDAIAQRLGGLPNDISVEGFTDSDPIATAEFPSNWYLSVARANRVRDYLERKGISPERMMVVGYGETRAVWSNATPEGKARNRRVDVVVLRQRQVIDLGQEIDSKRP